MVVLSILAVFSIFIAAGIHWQLPSNFGRAAIISTLVIVTSLLLSLLVFQPHYFSLAPCAPTNTYLSAKGILVLSLVLFFAVFVSLLTGILLRKVKTVNNN
jgi:hypothetical protein